MAPSSGELWNHPLMPTYIDVDCLLPTGVMIVQRCKRESSLEQVKHDLWQEAKCYPLYQLLGGASSYIFKSVTLDAEVEEFYDESRRLCDLRLFHPILKLVEPEGNREEKLINSDIGVAMNLSINEFNEIKQLEAVTFRRQILDVCQEAITQRNSLSSNNSTSSVQLALYKFPPNIESHPTPPEHVWQAIQDAGGCISMCVWIVPTMDQLRSAAKEKFVIKVSAEMTPEQIVEEVIRKRLISNGLSEEELKQACAQHKGTYMLRVCGLEEYLLLQCPISQYKYVRKCLLDKKSPHVMLVHKQQKDFQQSIVEKPFILPSYYRKGVSALDDMQSQKTVCLWNLDAPFTIKVHHAAYITVKEPGKLFVRAGIYHGLDPLCTFRDTKNQDSERPRWDEDLEFDLRLVDIPRAAKLCLGICFVSKKRQKNKQQIVTSLCWGNINLFDFTHRLQSDKKRLFMVQVTSDELLNPLLTHAPSSGEPGVPCLDIDLKRYPVPIQYPSDDVVDRLCTEMASRWKPQTLWTQAVEDQLKEISARDSLAELADQERTLLWENRAYCERIPNSLPKLLSSTDWGNREAVAQIYSLLARWPILEPEIALELLDCTYPDHRVRAFAVKCLEHRLDDNRMSLYLLQLVQVLKFEPYIDNPLTRFLLKRALLNQSIGHFFFWHLKSEMHTAERQRYGLIVEAYCRGCGSYLKSLIKQVDALEKLTKLTDRLKTEKDEDQRRFLEKQMGKADYLETLQHLTSPLDCSNKLGKLDPHQSKVMQSKKRPLKLTWTNDSPLAEHYQTDFKIIFKNGDDLRQDMLTLQVIRIMDSIWQSEGMDLKMLPYGVLASGNLVGVINVVRHAETVMHIMKSKMSAAMQLSSTQLHKWLKDHNDPSQYDQVIDNFTRSCAGYTIATYILGIGDRHPDNIMVTHDGKLFHIDFGHFLDHRKKKFGVNRERVPFILTEDLITTIARGNTNGKSSSEFRRFQELCGKAYMCLRKHASLLCTLFSMMLSSGMPELQTQNDISYLRKTLAVDSSEKAAVELFQSKFNEAYEGAWTTKVDWFFHWLKNKKS